MEVFLSFQAVTVSSSKITGDFLRGMRKKPSAFMRLFLSLAFCFGYFDGFKTDSSIIEDFKIMLATVKILFLPESTEGIAEGETTAMGQDEQSEHKSAV